MLHRTWSDKMTDIINIILLVVIAALMFVPFLYIFTVSFSSLPDVLKSTIPLWPRHWVWDNYQFVLASKPFIRSLFLTSFVTVFGTIADLIITSAMAYGLSRSFYGQRTILVMVLFTFLFGAGMIPTYLVVRATGLINSIWSLIIPGLIGPWNLIIMRQFFKNIPNELHEAALIDGANELGIFWRIVLPLSKPALATFSLFYAVGHWNAYFSALLYLNDSTKWPIQIVLRQIVMINDSTALTQGLMEQPLPPAETVQMATIFLATVPILIVYPFLQKHFAKGVMIGSVKG